MVLRILAGLIFILGLVATVVIVVAAEGWRKAAIFPLIFFTFIFAKYAIKGKQDFKNIK